MSQWLKKVYVFWKIYLISATPTISADTFKMEMASDDNDLEGAVGGLNLDVPDDSCHEFYNNQVLDDLINVDELKLEDEENW